MRSGESRRRARDSKPAAPPARSALTAEAPGACACLPPYTPLPTLSPPPPPQLGDSFQPPGLREGEGAGQARSGHLGVIHVRSCCSPAPRGLAGAVAPTQLESYAALVQKSGRDLWSPANSALFYPLGSGSLCIFPNSC